MTYKRLVFRAHALQRMFERRFSEEDVEHGLESGEVIEEYPDDKPYPSRLILGWVGLRPIHVVVADNDANRETIVITVYDPNPKQWEADFKKRKIMMKCVVCKNGETKAGKATVTLERDGTTLVVKGVPVRVCTNCGEEYVSQENTAMLLKSAEEAARAGVQVDVREHVAA